MGVVLRGRGVLRAHAALRHQDVAPRMTAPEPSPAFPTLTAAQVARIASHGTVRTAERGEVLLEAGSQAARFFVVTGGRLDVVRWAQGAEMLVTSHGPGQFTGEVNMLS